MLDRETDIRRAQESARLSPEEAFERSSLYRIGQRRAAGRHPATRS
jgi:hypothetical protein